jgi:hypothetical protein
LAYQYQPYPRSLYRKREGAHVYNGVPCDVLTVASAEAEETAKAQGWRNSPEEADAPTHEPTATAPAKKPARKGR